MWLRSPQVHFAAMGVLLLAARLTVLRPEKPEAAPVVITRAQIVDTEVLFQEGLARGLHRTDQGVRDRMVAVMLLLADNEQSSTEPEPRRRRILDDLRRGYEIRFEDGAER